MANTVVKMNNFKDRYADIEVNDKKIQAKRVRLGVDFKGTYKAIKNNNTNTIEIKEDGSIKSVIIIDSKPVTVYSKKTELGIDSVYSSTYRYAALKYSEGNYAYQIKCDSLFYYTYYTGTFQMYLVEYVNFTAKDKANYVFSKTK